MKYIYSLVMCSVLLLTSCVDQEAMNLEKVERMAHVIETNMNNNKAYDLNQMFSPTRFAMRLGSDFYDFPKIERQIAYAEFKEIYERTMYDYLNDLDRYGLKLLLYDIHKKDGVYRLNFAITDENSFDTNYVVFYAAFDKNDELKVVNLYDVFQGFSLSQIGTQILKNITDTSTSNDMRVYNANQSIAEAQKYANVGDYQKAYDLIKRIDKKSLRQPNIAHLKLNYASLISKELYLEELAWMKTVTPNEQSKLLYDCFISNIESGVELKEGEIGCSGDIVNSLLES